MTQENTVVVKKPTHSEKTIVVCPDCGFKVFYAKGKCRFCGVSLKESKATKKQNR